MTSTTKIPWQAIEAPLVPVHATNAEQITLFARQLRLPDIKRVVRAFDSGLYAFAVEFVWKRTISILKQQLSSLGMSFVGEMLARPDIVEGLPIEFVVTDYEAIQLACELGIISQLGSKELKHDVDLLSYYSNPELGEEEEWSYIQSLYLLQSCVVHILQFERMEFARDFMSFRHELTQKVLAADDPEIVKLIKAPYFFRRTTLRILLAEAKMRRGAQLENALSNLNTFVSCTWQELHEPERWQIGQAYTESCNHNLVILSSAMRSILMTVQGFDYVPDSLRSGTYTKVANDVLSAHEQVDNFCKELAPMKELVSLGTAIPGPAFQTCMRATLAVKLGNQYGHCLDAESSADQMLSSIGRQRWTNYLHKFLPSDEMILNKLMNEKPSNQWIALIKAYPCDINNISDKRIVSMLEAAQEGNARSVREWAEKSLQDLGFQP